MDKKKLETFRKKLETRQQELRRTVTRTQQDGRSADEDTAQDIADRAANSYTKEFLFSQSNNERQLLQMVDKALARIREGSFGECIHCGKEINAKRLEAGRPLDPALHRVPGETGTGPAGRSSAINARF